MAPEPACRQTLHLARAGFWCFNTYSAFLRVFPRANGDRGLIELYVWVQHDEGYALSRVFHILFQRIWFYRIHLKRSRIGQGFQGHRLTLERLLPVPCSFLWSVCPSLSSLPCGVLLSPSSSAKLYFCSQYSFVLDKLNLRCL